MGYSNADVLAASTVYHRPSKAVYLGATGTLTFYPEGSLPNHANNYPDFANSVSGTVTCATVAGTVLEIQSRYFTAVPATSLILWDNK